MTVIEENAGIQSLKCKNLRWIMDWLLEKSDAINPEEELHFVALNPDCGRGNYTGAKLVVDQTECDYHSYQTWMDLAIMFGFRFLTPERIDRTTVLLRYQKLDEDQSWHRDQNRIEKYQSDASFSKIRKTEEPCFRMDFSRALLESGLKKEWRVLNIGIHRGDEFEIFEDVFSSQVLQSLKFTGIDLNASAIEVARRRFQGKPNYHFICADMNDCDHEELGRQDMIISLGTFQSPGIRGKELIVRLRKEFLGEEGVIILGFPNSRYIDGEIKFGAKMKNYSEPELSLLIKDLFFYRRYLQQQGFYVKITGKYMIFLVAVKLKKGDEQV